MKLSKLFLCLILPSLLLACTDWAFEEAQAEPALQEIAQGLTTCSEDGHCGQNEACTQGGHCVDTTGQVSATAALQADFDNLDDAVGLGVPYALPPNANLLIDDLTGDGLGLTVNKRVIIEGRGSRFTVENGIIAMRIEGADWSSVRDLTFMPVAPREAHAGIGIDIRSHGVRLDNLYFNRMGTGVRAHTFVDGERANVNVQQWTRLLFNQSYVYAIDMSGGDANAGLLMGLEVRSGNGIRDNSFLGNTHIAPVLSNTPDTSLLLGSNAGASTVVGAYMEKNAPYMVGTSLHDLFLGGNAIDRLDSPADRIGRHAASLRFRHASGLRVRIPGADHAPMAMNHQTEDRWWYKRYFDHPDWRIWAMSYRNLGSDTVYRWTGGDHPEGPALYDLGSPLFEEVPDDGGNDDIDDGDNGNGGGPPPHARSRHNREEDSTTTQTMTLETMETLEDGRPDVYDEPLDDVPHARDVIDDDALFWELLPDDIDDQ